MFFAAGGVAGPEEGLGPDVAGVYFTGDLTVPVNCPRG